MPKAKAKAKVKLPVRPLAAPPKKDARTTDWVGIELAYTTTSRTQEDIGREFGVTGGRISQKAKEMGWKRGALVDRVRAKAAAKVAAQEAHDAQVEAGTEDAVEVSAVLMANTILRERRDVLRLMAVADKLLGRLEQSVADPAPPRGKRTELEPQVQGGALKRQHANELSEHLENLRKLGTTMNQLVTLERSVMGITDATPIDPTRRVEEAIENGMDKLREKFKARGVKV